MQRLAELPDRFGSLRWQSARTDCSEGFDNEVRVQLGKISDKFRGHFDQEQTARLNYIETVVVRLNALIETESKRGAL
jgi:hypothetical protein